MADSGTFNYLGGCSFICVPTFNVLARDSVRGMCPPHELPHNVFSKISFAKLRFFTLWGPQDPNVQKLAVKLNLFSRSFYLNFQMLY